MNPKSKKHVLAVDMEIIRPSRSKSECIAENISVKIEASTTWLTLSVSLVREENPLSIASSTSAIELSTEVGRRPK